MGLTIMWMERRYDTLYNMLENVGNSCLCKVVILRETIKVSLKLIYERDFCTEKGLSVNVCFHGYMSNIVIITSWFVG